MERIVGDCGEQLWRGVRGIVFADTTGQDSGDVDDAATPDDASTAHTGAAAEPERPPSTGEQEDAEAAKRSAEAEDEELERRMVELEQAAAERRRLKEEEAAAGGGKAAEDGDDVPVARASSARSTAAPVDQAAKDAQNALNAEWNKSAKKAVEGVQANDPTYTVVDLSGNTVFAMKHTEVCDVSVRVCVRARVCVCLCVCSFLCTSSLIARASVP